MTKKGYILFFIIFASIHFVLLFFSNVSFLKDSKIISLIVQALISSTITTVLIYSITKLVKTKST